MQNADIVLDECRVPEANRLQNANSFRDTAEILRRTRSGVAWQAVGVQFAAYEIALQYAKEREQFGRPIGEFQMVQDLLVQMLGNATACAGMMVRLAQLQDDGVYRDEQSALAKAFCTVADARDRALGTGVVGRQRHRARLQDRPLRRRRRGALLVRGHPRDADTLIVGQVRHRPERVRLRDDSDNSNTRTTESVFTGLKVVEIASFIAAPAAATMLSDFGADVIKVEPPGMGDPQRLLSSVPAEPGGAGKLQLALGQSQQARHVHRPEVGGRHGDPQASRRMGRRGDHQLPARHPRGPAPRLRGGVGLEPAGHLRRHHRVRGCRTGRQAARVRPDRVLVAQRAARLDPRRRVHRPTSPPWGSGDYTTATAIYAAITTALYHRERTGRGANVGTSLLATGVWATGTLVSAALAGGKPYELHDRNKPVNAMTNQYQTGDGRWIMLAARQSAWPGLATRSDASDLFADPRFANVKAIVQHSTELADLLDAEFSTQPFAPLADALDAARVPYGVIQTPEQAARDPQLRAADIVVPIEGVSELDETVSNPVTLRGLARVAPDAHPITASTTTRSSRSWDSASTRSKRCAKGKRDPRRLGRRDNTMTTTEISDERSPRTPRRRPDHHHQPAGAAERRRPRGRGPTRVGVGSVRLGPEVVGRSAHLCRRNVQRGHRPEAFANGQTPFFPIGDSAGSPRRWSASR